MFFARAALGSAVAHMERVLAGKNAQNCASIEDGYGGYLGGLLGLTPEAARLCVLAAIGLFVWTHGRAVLRAAGIALIALVVTLWASLRRLRRALFRSTSPRVPTNGAQQKPPSSAAASYMGPALPAVRASGLEAALREVQRLHDECDALAAAEF